MTALTIPDSMRAAVHFLLGEADGNAWLDALPAAWTRYARRWDLALDAILTGGQMSCVLLCHDTVGNQLILKIPVDPVVGIREVAALTAWGPTGAAPHVHHHDPDTGVIVMTYVPPGDIEAQDPHALAVLLDRLANARFTPELFPDLRTNVDMRLRWARDRFAIPDYAEGARFLAPAQEVADQLLADSPRHHLLHGDLQPKNIHGGSPAGNGRLTALDPLAVTGDQHFDGAFWCVMRPGPASIQDNLTELSRAWTRCDPDRLHTWATVVAALEFRPYQQHRRDQFLQFLTHARPAT